MNCIQKSGNTWSNNNNLNVLKGVDATLSTSELNKLVGLTVNASTLNQLSGLSATGEELNSLLEFGADVNKLNILNGIDTSLSKDELNMLVGLDVEPFRSPNVCSNATKICVEDPTKTTQNSCGTCNDGIKTNTGTCTGQYCVNNPNYELDSCGTCNDNTKTNTGTCTGQYCVQNPSAAAQTVVVHVMMEQKRRNHHKMVYK